MMTFIVNVDAPMSHLYAYTYLLHSYLLYVVSTCFRFSLCMKLDWWLLSSPGQAAQATAARSFSVASQVRAYGGVGGGEGRMSWGRGGVVGARAVNVVVAVLSGHSVGRFTPIQCLFPWF